jgi:hypothetical protein
MGRLHKILLRFERRGAMIIVLLQLILAPIFGLLALVLMIITGEIDT